MRSPASSQAARPGKARNRPPARPRHLGAARRRPLGGGARTALELVKRARARAHLPRPRPRPARLAQRPDRGSDRPGSRRSDPPVARHRLAARGDHPLRRARDPRREHASSESRLETGRMHQIRVHLAAIDLPVVGDRGLRGHRSGARPPVPPRNPARVPASVHRRAARGRLAAASRARRVSRRAQLNGRCRYDGHAPDPRPGGRSTRTVAGFIPVPLRHRRRIANRTGKGLTCPLSP